MAARQDYSQPRQPTNHALHTYRPGCSLAPAPQPEPDAWLEGIPASNAQFFYASIVPIDDPLSAPSSDSTSKSAKLPLQPFSPADSNRLETAWLQLFSEKSQENHTAARQKRNPGAQLSQSNETTLDLVERNLIARHRLKHLQETCPEHDALTAIRATLQGAATSIPVCCEQLLVDAQAELRTLFCPLAIQNCSSLSVGRVMQRIMIALNHLKSNPAESNRGSISAITQPGVASTAALQDSRSRTQQPEALSEQPNKNTGPPSLDNYTNNASSSSNGMIENTRGPISISQVATSPASTNPPLKPPIQDDGISGKPFLRPDMPRSSFQSSASFSPLSRLGGPGSLKTATNIPSVVPSNRDHNDVAPADLLLPPDHTHDSPPTPNENSMRVETEALQEEINSTSSLLGRQRKSFEVAVGISRLHTVELPSLTMKPIYWSPVHDISTVQRATWFYRDTMMPLEATVANQLESLYRELRPWTETWNIELRCAIELGPIGEEKLSQPLWPPVVWGKDRARADAAQLEPKISSDLFCASRCFHGAAAAMGIAIPPAAPEAKDSDGSSSVGNSPAPAAAERSFASYHAIFKDGTSAFLLKPSLKPSAYYGRRPIAKIFKGATVGIPVVRGFNRSSWDHIHDKPAGDRTSRASRLRDVSNSHVVVGEDQNEQGGHLDCAGCRDDKMRGQVSDLVLVIHGVGQKLAERIESFHFTHAVNGLRRAMNAELKTPPVRSILRDGHNGVMVLPINWRHTLSFEDGGFHEKPDQEGGSGTGVFELKDIEQSSIPAVRGMISDVMFDIPFYMSHHKPKMILSLVREANRVYRLWCQNNPGFSENGRVHLIGHSLGSAMAVEVLSKQPTTLPHIQPNRALPETDFFEFDTKNLFLLGSPAAFFLLLERGALLPRRGRQKPGMDVRHGIDARVVGEAGTFGCLAVDNIYNILAKEDPIAYLLNGTIDTAYAASLKPAHVPSASVGLFASIGHSLRSIIPGTSTSPLPAGGSLSTPAPLPVVRLPSQLELEVHDFTREEIAEHKAYLLNDNGQVDYFLQSGGGPLEIQYLNMLSAHTSYWTNQDLIRMLCVEIGRRPGKGHAVPAMRAVKSSKRVVQNLVEAHNSSTS